MDLTSQTELYVSFSLDEDTNILTVDFKDIGLVSLGTISIENSKFRSFVKALGLVADERIVNPQFKGEWDASANEPVLSDIGMGTPPTPGDVYLVVVSGTQDLGSGTQTFYAGNWVFYDGISWKRTYTDAEGVKSTTGFNVQDNAARISFG